MPEEKRRVKPPPIEPIPEIKVIEIKLPPLPEVTEDDCLNPQLRLSWISKRTWEIMRKGYEARKVIPWRVGIRQAWNELETTCARKFGVRIR